MKKRFPIFIIAIVAFLLGISVGAIFFFWGIEAIRYDTSASGIVICFARSLFFFAVGFFGLMLFSFGHNAYLRTEYGVLSAHYGFNTDLELPLAEIEDVIFAGELARVFTAKKVYNIFAPMDNETRGRLGECGKKPWEISRGTELAAYEKAKKAHLVSLAASCVLFAMLILNGILSNRLTGETRVGELTGRDDAIWLAFFFCGIITAVAVFASAYICIKMLFEKERRLCRIGSAAAYEKRFEEIDKNAVRVVFFDNYRVRAIIKQVYGAYACDLHIIDPLSSLWQITDSRVGETVAEIDSIIEERLGKLPVCEEKLFN